MDPETTIGVNAKIEAFKETIRIERLGLLGTDIRHGAMVHSSRGDVWDAHWENELRRLNNLDEKLCDIGETMGLNKEVVREMVYGKQK